MSALWREFTVEGADFLVFVSDDGMVKIGERTITQFNGKKTYSRIAPPKNLKPMKNSSGYYQVKINFNNGEYKHFYVHRMVASQFVDNPLGLHEVDHLDGDKANNTANNLRWVTRAQNMAKCLKDNPHILQNLKHHRPLMV